MWHDEDATAVGRPGRRWGAVRALLAEATVAVLMLMGLGAGALSPAGLHLEGLTDALGARVQAWGSEALTVAWRHATAQGGLARETAEVRALPAFQRVAVRGAVRVVVRPGSPQVQVWGAPLQRARVRTEVVDGTLTITLAEEGVAAHTSTVEVAAAGLEGIDASLGSALELEGLSGGSLELSVRGGSQVRAQGLALSRLQVVAASGSRVRLEGQGVEELHLHASSGSTLLARALPVRRLCVRASGGARIEAQAEVSLAGQLGDASQLVVLGHPPERVVAAARSARILYL